MGDETHVETVVETPTASTEAAAAEALADVAKAAIEESAQRVESLTMAIAALGELRSELAALRAAFDAHVSSNADDFARVAEGMGALSVSVAALESALEAEADAVEEVLREEIREELEEEIAAAAEVTEVAPGVASVEAAEAAEPERFTPAAETPAAESPAPAAGGRRFLDRIF